jgi:hypothetical protein
MQLPWSRLHRLRKTIHIYMIYDLLFVEIEETLLPEG